MVEPHDLDGRAEGADLLIRPGDGDLALLLAVQGVDALSLVDADAAAARDEGPAVCFTLL